MVLLSYYKNGEKILEELMKMRSMMVQSYEKLCFKDAWPKRIPEKFDFKNPVADSHSKNTYKTFKNKHCIKNMEDFQNTLKLDKRINFSRLFQSHFQKKDLAQFITRSY